MTNQHDTPNPSPPDRDPDLKETAREAGAAVRERAGEMGEAARAGLAEAGSAAQEKAESVRGQAADEISRTARGLDAAADELGESPFQQDLLREAADGLQHLARTVQGKSVGALVEDLSDFGRNNPLAYLGGAALAGFALARFAKASSPDDAPMSRGPAYAGSGTSPGGRSMSRGPTYAGPGTSPGVPASTGRAPSPETPAFGGTARGSAGAASSEMSPGSLGVGSATSRPGSGLAPDPHPVNPDPIGGKDNV